MTRFNRFSCGLVAAAAALAIHGTTPGLANAQGRSTEAPSLQVGEPLQEGRLRTTEIEPNRYELIYSGKRLGSRSEVELYLLYRSALLASEKGAVSFSLLYLPGEEGPASHPAPPGPSSKQDYGHWQPHWSYYVIGLGWQPWHPEWGAAFWADAIDAARIERFEVHAIIRLSDATELGEDQPDFRVSEVLHDLERRFR